MCWITCNTVKMTRLHPTAAKQMVSLNWAIIASGYSLSPARRQAIPWPILKLCLSDPYGKPKVKFRNYKSYMQGWLIFFLDITVRKMLAILTLPLSYPSKDSITFFQDWICYEYLQKIHADVWSIVFEYNRVMKWMVPNFFGKIV